MSARTGSGERPAGRRLISLRLIATLAVMALISVTVLTMGMVQERNVRRTLTREVTSRLLLEARNLAYLSADALLSDFPELSLQPMVQEILGKRPELAFVLVLDHEGRIQGHEDPRWLGQIYTFGEDLSPHTPSSSRLANGERFLSSHDHFVVIAPATHEGGRIVGQAVIGLERFYLNALVGEARQQQFIIIAVLMIMGMICGFFLVSWILRPVKALRTGLERIGRGDLDTPLQLRDRTELGLLADTVNTMAGELRVAQAGMVERERLAHELTLAQNIQQSLLPDDFHGVGEFTVLGSQIPATEVGGDYYDVFELSGNRLGLVVADVAGKGLAGCMTTSMLSAYLRAYRESFDSPVDLFLAVEKQLVATLGRGSFVTMFYGILDLTTGVLTFGSAGHNRTLLYRKAESRIESLNPRGLPLGILKPGKLPYRRENGKVTLYQGDVLLQYTDGISEAVDSSGKMFGEEGIEAVLNRVGVQGGVQVLDRLKTEVKAWTGEGTQGDDETILVISREFAQTRVDDISGRESTNGEGLASMVEAAEKTGMTLELPTELPGLDSRITTWLCEHPSYEQEASDHQALIATSLYEICANIIEHGYPRGTTMKIKVHYLPPDPSQQSAYLICDHGTPFDPQDRKALDWSSSEARLKGRGIGLHIVHRVMNEVRYEPGTPRGNITLLKFDPALTWLPKEA